MKDTQTLFYAIGALAFPWVALAHGGVDDGHEEVATGNPEQRIYVLAGVGIVAVLLIGFMWYSRRKNTPTFPQNDNGGRTP